MMPIPIADRLRAVPDGRDAYATSLLFRHIVDTVEATERFGHMDGIETLGRILITLSRARDAEIAEAVDQAMRTVKPMMVCMKCAQSL